jgi:hypothetical protein
MNDEGLVNKALEIIAAMSYSKDPTLLRWSEEDHEHCQSE